MTLVSMKTRGGFEVRCDILEIRVTHLLLPLLQVEKHEVIICKITFGESQADTISIGRPARAI